MTLKSCYAFVFVSLFSSFVAAQTVIPGSSQNGVLVGAGWVEATNRQVIRTASNVVYVVVSDDSPCLSNSSPTSGVIRVYKGSGAIAGSPNVPAAFAEVDAAHHPAATNAGSCVFTGGAANLLFAPDARLDSSGVIHLAYIDPSVSTVYYQTFNTSTDLWGTRQQIGANAQTNVGGGWPRGSHVALTLDSANHPYVAFAAGGTSNSIQWTAKTASAGSAWTAQAQLVGSSGPDQFQPSMVTALDGSIQLAWLDNALATHSTIRYARFSGGVWSAVETVSTGDPNVLADGDHDQIPAIATDRNSRPCVLYLDGTVNGTDNYVRFRCKNSSGSWVDNTPSGAAGPSNPNGTWYCHTPSNYISSVGDIFVFLGHDVNISPGPFQYQSGGIGGAWSAVNQLDPRNQTNTTSGAPGLDGSASVRFDPLRDNNTSIIDILYYDENDGTAGYSHHATIYYKAIQIPGTPPSSDFVLAITPAATVNSGGTATASLTATSIDGFSAPISLSVSGCPTLSVCTISPGSVSPSAGSAATAILTVVTRAATTARGPNVRRISLSVLLSIAIFGVVFRPVRKRRFWIVAVAVGIGLLLAACNSASNSGTNSQPGTPPGTYTLQVTGSSGTTTHQSNAFLLTVQ